MKWTGRKEGEYGDTAHEEGRNQIKLVALGADRQGPGLYELRSKVLSNSDDFIKKEARECLTEKNNFTSFRELCQKTTSK